MPDDAGGQGTVDEGAVYDHIYVEEAVPEDGDVGEDWDDEQREQTYKKDVLKNVVGKRIKRCEHELREVDDYKVKQDEAETRTCRQSGIKEPLELQALISPCAAQPNTSEKRAARLLVASSISPTRAEANMSSYVENPPMYPWTPNGFSM